MSMKQAFKDLKGVWPDNDRQLLHWRPSVGDYIATIYHYTSIPLIQYIGTREEFEACRKEKWHTWNGCGEIPTGVTRVMFRNGEIVYGDELDFSWSHNSGNLDVVVYTRE